MPVLTGTGVAVLGGGALVLAGGLVGGYAALAGLGAAAPVLVLAAVAIMLLPDRLEARRTVTNDRVTVGSGITCAISVRNAGRLPMGWTDAADRIGGEEFRAAIAPLGRGASARAEYVVPTTRRGLLILGPLVLERRDPLGLAVRRRTVAGASAIWVHPRAHPLRALPAGTLPDMDGELGGHAPHGTSTFAGLREYQPGDDPRLIHWRSTARTGALLVQERVDSSEPAATVVLDTRAEVLEEVEFEEAVEVAASIVAAHVRSGLAVAGEDAREIAAMGARGPLDRLAAARLGEGLDVSAVHAPARHAAPGGQLILVTGTDAGVLARFAAEAPRFSLLLIVQLDSAATSSTVIRRGGATVIRASTAAAAVRSIGRLDGGRA
ncbi:DUF58 domain-containing protein [Nonomuraea turkmeniaca]|uniref:DUF58 domain-containing protein n=1 Tax=Nonomuraea turkmeniaca TaxID=103838 RepID=A0A5S4EYY6_9ACTN|nr:DUF58 domain-containing protein [Nonomuraea turkmeniaca]TMR08954.1 DUF58 domain-containing protein [Nonomuraea turkmeniaca]